MTTIAIEDKYAEALKPFGNLQMVVELALQRYTIEQITTKIRELRQREAQYQAKYSLDYPAFAQRIAQDEAFVRLVEATINPSWEIDLTDWEFCYKGSEDWTQELWLKVNIPIHP